MSKSRAESERGSEEVALGRPQWRPQGTIPDPEPMPGWRLGWKRTAMRGTPDAASWSASVREGWEPVHPSEQPLLRTHVAIPGQATADWIEVGGLVLCKLPAEIAAQRDRYYDEKGRAAEASVDHTLKQEFSADSRVRLINDRQSDVRYT